VGRENIFKPTIGNESLHQDSNDNGVRSVNSVTSKNLVLKTIVFYVAKFTILTLFPHRNIRKYTRTATDWKTHNQIDHILTDRRWDSSILDVRSFRVAGCDTDHYLVVEKVKAGVEVSK
jgi:hypothetical protein